MSKDQITITINDKTHQFKAGDVDAMRDMPWPERKQLIDLLENIKQAEFVKPAEPLEPIIDANFNSTSSAANQSSSAATKNPQPPSGLKVSASSAAPQLDAEIKASDKDADDLMNRLILEQKQHQKAIPDKSAVIKVMLIVFAVIIALILIF